MALRTLSNMTDSVATKADAPAQPRGLAPSVIVAIVVTVLAWASAFIVIRGTAPYFTGGGQKFRLRGA